MRGARSASRASSQLHGGQVVPKVRLENAVDVVLEREDKEDRGDRGKPVERLEGVLQADGCKTLDMNVNGCGDLTDSACRNDTNAVSEDRLARMEIIGSGIVLNAQIATSQS